VICKLPLLKWIPGTKHKSGHTKTDTQVVITGHLRFSWFSGCYSQFAESICTERIGTATDAGENSRRSIEYFEVFIISLLLSALNARQQKHVTNAYTSDTNTRTTHNTMVLAQHAGLKADKFARLSL
jgi:hypothetical protein